MSTHHEDANFGILQQVFADVANDVQRDPIEHLLVLTYEFDDQQLINLLSGRRLADNVELQRNHLKFIADMHPVVIYDARKTREFNQIPHFLDLLPVNPGAYRCHHSKAYLFVTRATVRLVIGSFNLTRTGLFENREVFVDFLWNDNQTAELNILSEFSKLLRVGYEQWAQPAAAGARLAIADTLDARLSLWQVDAVPGKYSLLHSGYGQFGKQNGLQSLTRLWHSISDTAPKKILVVSPFFDRSDTCIADELVKAIGVPTDMHIVTDEANILKLGKLHYGAGKKGQQRKLSLIPALISKRERERISHANDGARLGDLHINRTLHAKILVLCSGSNHLVYTGSANFTLKAWNGDNQELGVASIEVGNANILIDQILSAIGAINAEYERLGDFPEHIDEVDDEEYVEQPAYPDFIKGILLRDDPGGSGLVFGFNTAEVARLLDYSIHWGRVHLLIDGANSQVIPREQAYMPLQGGRNLSFSPRSTPDKAYLLPFVHDAELTRQQDLLLFPSAEDWMRYYINPVGPSGLVEGEYMPGESVRTTNEDSESTVDRDANAVVSMQRYLNLFSAVENSFNQRAIDIANTAFVNAAARTKECEQRLAEPLRIYARLLEQEYRRKPCPITEQVYLFRLGELVLLCSTLTDSLPELVSLTRELAAGITAPNVSTPMDTYIDFVRGRLLHA